MRNYMKWVGFTLSAVVMGLSASAQAIMVAPVSINEIYDPSTGEGHFDVFNNSSSGLYMFAVANDGVKSSWSNRPDWATGIVQKADWNADALNAINLSMAPWTGMAPTGWTLPTIGTNSWDSLFGASTNQVVVYMTGIDFFDVASYADNHLVPGGASLNEFRFSTNLLASPFVAWDENGNILMQGNTSETVVPVPAAIWLLGSGLLGLAGVARRRV